MSSVPQRVSPSQLPALAQCPCYQASRKPSPAADRGGAQHRILSQWIKGGGVGVSGDLNPQEIAQVKWAYHWIRQISDGQKVEVDVRMTLKDKRGMQYMSGSADAIIVPYLIDDDESVIQVVDYKSGEMYDYKRQMFAYALMAMDKYRAGAVLVREAYGRYEKAAPPYRVVREQAQESVMEVVRAVSDPKREPHPCDYCGWCDHAGRCIALGMEVEQIVLAQGGLYSYDPSELARNPEELLRAYQVTDHVTAWAAAVKDWCNELFVKQGTHIPEGSGYYVQERNGSRGLKDITTARAASSLDPVVFDDACSVTLGKLVALYAEHFGLTEKAAEEKVLEELGGVIVRGAPSRYLAKKRGKG